MFQGDRIDDYETGGETDDLLQHCFVELGSDMALHFPIVAIGFEKCIEGVISREDDDAFVVERLLVFGEMLRFNGSLLRNLRKRDIEKELGTNTQFAFDIQGATKVFAEAPADCEAESCTSEITCRGSISLSESLENTLVILDCDTDSGILHVHVNQRIASSFCLPRRKINGDDDFSRVREFDGITEKVYEYLLESFSVTKNQIGDLRIEKVNQLDLAFCRILGEHFDSLFEEANKVDRLILEFHLVRL